jgi:RNA polymerase sigma-70 factor (ECF subfamily)
MGDARRELGDEGHHLVRFDSHETSPDLTSEDASTTERVNVWRTWPARAPRLLRAPKIESTSAGRRPYRVSVPTRWAPWRKGMDTDLVTAAQHGDEEAFASLAIAVGGRLHAVAHRILRDLDLAEDATQQALLTIWRDLPHLRDPARFEAWSYRLLVRACYAEGRRARHWAPNLHVLSADEPWAPEGLSGVHDRDQLERGFRRLSIDHRAVVVLHHYLDLPLGEVAEALGVPEGTVRSRLHHAMRGLRAALEADERPAVREVAR